MIKPQHIYKAKNFIFENNASPAPKYFIVFHIDEESILLFSLTTSKSKLPSDLDLPEIEGCVFFNDECGYGHSYILKQDYVIGSNNFAFSERTYIQIEFRTQLKEINSNNLIEKYVTKELIECCCLFDDEFDKILFCLLKSKFLKNKYKRAIQQKLIRD